MTVVYQIAVDQMEAPVAVPTDKEKNVALAMKKDSYVVAIDRFILFITPAKYDFDARLPDGKI